MSAIRCMKVMCDVYQNNPNTYIISYEEMFDIILHKLQEGFKVDVIFLLLYYIIVLYYLKNYLKNISRMILVKKKVKMSIPIEFLLICNACNR